MKRLVKISMLAGALAFSGHLAYGLAKPVVGGEPVIPLFADKSAIGLKDGILRVIWDYNPAKFPAPSSYAGSALWLIDPNGTVVATGYPTIPATVGAHYISIFPFERSNLFISAQPSGNTTVVFVYPNVVEQFGVWTYNSAGTLISAASYGPFSGAFIGNFYFEGGKLIIKWRSTSSKTAHAAWVLNEFGGIDSATAFFDFAGVILGHVFVNASGQQVWPYSANSDKSSGPFALTVWTFNPTGSTVVNANVFGPF